MKLSYFFGLFFVISVFLLLLVTSNNAVDQCSSIRNEDKIDCAPNDPKWTVAGCLAKGCCHAAVSDSHYPACFLNHSHIREAKCTRVSVNLRRDCGDIHTTEISCGQSGCCWEIVPGAPYCYHPDNANTSPDTHTNSPDIHTNPPDNTDNIPIGM